MDGLLGRGALEDVAAGDEDVDTGLYKLWSCLTLHATINLDEGLAATLGNELSKLTDFLEGVLDEGLTAESGIDAHQKYHFNVAYNVLEHRDGRGGIQSDASLHAGIMNLLYRAVQVVTGVEVNVHHHGAEFGRLLDIALRLHYHVVHVEGFLAE